MTKVIHKYTLEKTASVQALDCPFEAKFIAFQFQHDQPRVWAEVDTTLPNRSRSFVIIGTGGDVPDNGKHIGTWQQGLYVWHLYEVKP